MSVSLQSLSPFQPPETNTPPRMQSTVLSATLKRLRAETTLTRLYNFCRRRPTPRFAFKPTNSANWLFIPASRCAAAPTSSWVEVQVCTCFRFHFDHVSGFFARKKPPEAKLFHAFPFGASNPIHSLSRRRCAAAATVITDEEGQITFYRQRPTPSYKIKSVYARSCFHTLYDCEPPRSGGACEYTIFGVPASEVSLPRATPHYAFEAVDPSNPFRYPCTREPPRSAADVDSHMYRRPASRYEFQVQILPPEAKAPLCPQVTGSVEPVPAPASRRAAAAMRKHDVLSSRKRRFTARLLPPKANTSLQVQSSVTASTFSSFTDVEQRPKGFHDVSNSRDHLFSQLSMVSFLFHLVAFFFSPVFPSKASASLQLQVRRVNSQVNLSRRPQFYTTSEIKQSSKFTCVQSRENVFFGFPRARLHHSSPRC
ncbi:hypothetical protein C8R43DRAFT_1233748 [Mycena crocata]|nr:hypothetical protein C8R43DRAFT_1233748 [Mycena crocata]